MMIPSSVESCWTDDIQAQLRRIEERETLIHSIGTKHHLNGYDHSPLERENVIEFISRFGDLRRRQNAETERLQVIHQLCVAPECLWADTIIDGKPHHDGRVQCHSQEIEFRTGSLETTEVGDEEPDCENLDTPPPPSTPVLVAYADSRFYSRPSAPR